MAPGGDEIQWWEIFGGEGEAGIPVSDPGFVFLGTTGLQGAPEPGTGQKRRVAGQHRSYLYQKICFPARDGCFRSETTLCDR